MSFPTHRALWALALAGGALVVHIGDRRAVAVDVCTVYKQGCLASDTVIELTGKQLTGVVDTTWFGNVSAPAKILVLNLGNNQLTYIAADAFGAFVNLVHLELWTNILTQIPPTVVSLTYLNVLDLGNNQIASLPSHSLDMLTRLTLLHIDTNKFTYVPDHFFDALTQLTDLNLANNNVLLRVPRYAFVRLTKITSKPMDFTDCSTLQCGALKPPNLPATSYTISVPYCPAPMSSTSHRPKTTSRVKPRPRSSTNRPIRRPSSSRPRVRPSSSRRRRRTSTVPRTRTSRPKGASLRARSSSVLQSRTPVARASSSPAARAAPSSGSRSMTTQRKAATSVRTQRPLALHTSRTTTGAPEPPPPSSPSSASQTPTFWSMITASPVVAVTSIVLAVASFVFVVAATVAVTRRCLNRRYRQAQTQQTHPSSGPPNQATFGIPSFWNSVPSVSTYVVPPVDSAPYGVGTYGQAGPPSPEVYATPPPALLPDRQLYQGAQQRREPMAPYRSEPLPPSTMRTKPGAKRFERMARRNRERAANDTVSSSDID